MAKASISVTLDVSGFDKYNAAAQEALAAAVQAEAEEIATDAASRAPVLTGQLRDSIRADQEDATTWTVHDGVAWGIFNEYGTVHMAAQPWLTPAVEEGQSRFPERLRQALQDAAEGH